VSQSRALRTLGAGVLGAGIAAVAAEPGLRLAPARLRRVNVAGRDVPAILGAPLLAGTLGGLAISVNGTCAGETRRTMRSVAVLAVTTALAGLADDLRGDEPARGFRGHLTAAARGRVTGGLVKVGVGGIAALVAGRTHQRDVPRLETAALVALGANLVNLLDRAPGRAAKVALASAAPLLAAGRRDWALASAPLWGALVACAPADLAEAGMLGDAGANPVGAVLGLGAALSLRRPWRIATIALLVGLNLASERWSFSRAIARTPWVRRLDDFGRRDRNPGAPC